MPNHWHLLLWPRRDGELSEILRWITVTHTQRWHAHHHTAGTGPVYQGRFKSFPVQTDEHFLTVARYVERNALRAKLVTREKDWQWSSLWRRNQEDTTLTAWLSTWRGATTGLGGVSESARNLVRTGIPRAQCATRTPLRRGRLGTENGESVRDGNYLAAPRAIENIMRKDS
jgi:hypothetical protein